MAAHHDARRVHAQRARVRRLAQVGEHRGRVLERVVELERARTSPRAAIVERDDVPAGPAQHLRDVVTLLVARQPVQEHERRMDPGPGREEREAVHAHAVRRQMQHLVPRRVLRVARRIDEQRPRRRLRAERGREKQGGGQERSAHVSGGVSDRARRRTSRHSTRRAALDATGGKPMPRRRRRPLRWPRSASSTSSSSPAGSAPPGSSSSARFPRRRRAAGSGARPS